MASTSNSSTVYSNVKVPLFEGENYDFWAVKMETLFTSLDVLEFVRNGYEEPAPTEVEESSQRLEELKKKKKITDAGVLRMIQRAVTISIFPRIMRAKTSKEAWNILQQEFEEDSKRPLRGAVYSSFWRSDRGESSRGGRFGKGMGRGRNSRGRGRGANGGRWHEGASNKWCKICKSNTYNENDCWNKGKPQCHNCKRFRYIQKDYRFVNQQHASFAEGENDEGNLFFACQKAFQEDKNVWYLDSGCSNHMIGKKKAFIKINSSFGSKVKLGNGEHVEVKGKGNIGVTTKQGSKVIHESLYVPELDENLLSIGQLLEHDYSLNFENRECGFFDSKRKNDVVVKMTNNRSFPLSLNYEKKLA
ncbi:hypothetical protein KIW84_075471 [Lathyrus oleraceus]|uniref:Retrovirus-related Pol polyprotein from transposon TNT 1-94-like beta-barrel domain-containing protein n=1 Tax=Pisum sativum TaxID=3888 RepID=A0A9D4VWS5_PEA|nr:hypothetical protein KIW84_075471 [Pisum sativum]